MKDPLLGRLVAQRYRLISRLGAGGMASVYLARHVLIERLGAIKFLLPELGKNAVARDRFLREARAVNRINHPNIVEITDYGEAEGLVYLVMEYVPGEALQRHLVSGPIGWRRAVHIGLQVASALGRAHQMGVIHRDLKPANILLIARRGGDDLVKLTDFGVAKLTGAPTLTTSSIALGTPGYVAPEYQEFGNVDPRCDLYSLGVVLYEAVSGVLPFGTDAPRRAAAAERLTARVSDVPEFFDEVVMTLLARDPDDRPRDGYEVYDLLRRVLEREGLVFASTPPRPGPHGSALAASSPSVPVAESHPPGPASSAPSPPRRTGPHLTTVSFERIGPVCSAALARLTAWADQDGVTPAAEASIEQARKLVAMSTEIARIVATDGGGIEALQTRGRSIRADLGRKLDEVARERSKILGWAGTIAERSYLVASRRQSGEHSIPAVDAMVWEQAALEHEEERVRAKADELATRIDEISAEITAQNERLEHEMLVAAAQLDGHIAALRSIALEAWMSLEEAARRLGRAPEGLFD